MPALGHLSQENEDPVNGGGLEHPRFSLNLGIRDFVLDFFNPVYQLCAEPILRHA